ncbi:hypothetical protein SSPIM334S_02523 [Streptomyces spiroverticillatus]
MSRAATEWVWDHATARGTARIVLLAIADRANGDAVAYAGTAMLVQRTRAARSTVRDAVDALLDSGELVVVEGATGPRGETVYRLPLVAEHALSEGAGIRSGPESGPGRKSAPRGPESGTEGGRNPGRDPGPRRRHPADTRGACVAECRTCTALKERGY